MVSVSVEELYSFREVMYEIFHIYIYSLFNTQCHCSLSALDPLIAVCKDENNCLRNAGAVLFVSREIIRGNTKRAKTNRLQYF